MQSGIDNIDVMRWFFSRDLEEISVRLHKHYLLAIIIII